MDMAIVAAANRPTCGSTPAISENAMASGINASATIRPASTSVFSQRGRFRVARTDWRSSGVAFAGGAVWIVVDTQVSHQVVNKKDPGLTRQPGRPRGGASGSHREKFRH